jgi:hypothetical protein
MWLELGFELETMTVASSVLFLRNLWLYLNYLFLLRGYHSVKRVWVFCFNLPDIGTFAIFQHMYHDINKLVS